jgi:hypothetical protein
MKEYIISFTDNNPPHDEKFLIFREGFFRSQIWVYKILEQKPVLGCMHTQTKKMYKVYTNPLMLLKNWNSKDKVHLRSVFAPHSHIEKHYWLTVKYFPGFRGSYKKNFKNNDLKEYTFENFRDNISEYIILHRF